ncbi:DegT/DnrJ/EryC1/StrS family aminotransferase [Lysinibacillus antri]|uniref:DegT/DnrJ/EryC1/StrS aminotransferase family protein n=1 Tax=Lysinibacillus antri TaxID=2498145 RepID=A0A432L8X3_9BACI|nr:DegT/DnrJ/EryC1/StrS aminotransferase family protein [Lysinibacillus antri]RUL48692.1 DegT/DnrJ/EryC1/StrS aminotransferase family protein [Lysinibacillus antri]
MQSGEQRMTPHNRPTLGKKEEKAALQVLRSGWVAQGKAVEAFENEMCRVLGLPMGCAVAVSSGSAALFLSLLALEAQGKNVAYPAHTCAALRNATALAGGNSILIDSEEKSPNIDINHLSTEAIDIAIIPHMYGLPVNLSNRPSSIQIIEDCAQALGASVNGVPVGLQGDIGIFSFYATKLITSGGQGGMVVSKNHSIIQFIRDYLLFDQRHDAKIRFNFQMTDVQGAIGLIQLKQLPYFIKRRQEIFQQYEDANLSLLQSAENSQQVPYRAIMLTQQQSKVINALKSQHVNAVIPLKEEHLLGLPTLFPNAYQWTQQTVSLPIYPTLANEEVQRIIKIIKNIT